MSEQPAEIIETIARNQKIDLQNASLEKQLYIYALTFGEIQRRLSGSLINFPIESLQEIIDAFNYIFDIFNNLLIQQQKQILHNDILLARSSLLQALSLANAAMTMQLVLIPNSLEYFQALPIYQQHLLNCSIQAVNISNQISNWLQPG